MGSWEGGGAAARVPGTGLLPRPAGRTLLEALPGGRRGASVPPALQRRGRVMMPGPGRGSVLRVLRQGAGGPQGALGKRRGTFL